MEAEEVVRLYNLFKKNGIQVWIDGGWGIDALIGKQTRHHDDLDIAVNRKDEKKLRSLLTSNGYDIEIKRDYTSDWNYVLGDKKGNKIDIHVFEFDAQGKNIYGIVYPKESLTGKGIIKGQKVNCISPEWIIKFHENYEPAEKDLKDIQALSEKFAIKPPKNYK